MILRSFSKSYINNNSKMSVADKNKFVQFTLPFCARLRRGNSKQEGGVGNSGFFCSLRINIF